MNNLNPHIQSIVEAKDALDRALNLAATYEATQDRQGRASQAEHLRLETDRRVATLLHNLTLETPDHAAYSLTKGEAPWR